MAAIEAFNQQDYRESASKFEEVVAANPSDSFASIYLSYSLIFSERYSQALDTLRTILPKVHGRDLGLVKYGIGYAGSHLENMRQLNWPIARLFPT